MGRVLVVEDEPAIAELIALYLRHQGFEVATAANADAAQAHVDQILPDLVILDWMLPGTSGVQLARRWRADPRTREVPIIMLTARAAESDKVAGLDAGADDFLTKPFSPAELQARIRAVLRRRAPSVLDLPVEVGRLKLEPASRRVSFDTHRGRMELKLGPTEFRLLHVMMSQPERVHSRAQLLNRAWGDHVFIEERTVDVHVKRLREALAPAGAQGMVETVRGAGYRLVATPAASAGGTAGEAAGEAAGESA